MNADQGSLRSFRIETPASLAATDYPLLPPPGQRGAPHGHLDAGLRRDPARGARLARRSGAVLAALSGWPAAHDLHLGGRSLRGTPLRDDLEPRRRPRDGEHAVPAGQRARLRRGSGERASGSGAESAGAGPLHERVQPHRRDAGRHSRRPRLRAGDGERRDRRAHGRSTDPCDRGRRGRSQRRRHRRDRSGRAPAGRERPARPRGPLLRAAGAGPHAARRVHRAARRAVTSTRSISPRSTRSPRWRRSTRRCSSTEATRARASATRASSMPRSPSKSTRSRTERRPRAATASWWRPLSITREAACSRPSSATAPWP